MSRDTQAKPQQTEREFLQAFVEYAELMGWKVHHVLEQKHYAKRIGPGFPDCVLVRDDRLIFAELKTDSGKVSELQWGWLDALEEAGAKCYIWRPSMWSEIEEVLGRG